MTPRRLQLLQFIAHSQAQAGGKCPTFREMRQAMRVKSNETIEEFLRGLEKDGYIKRVAVGSRRRIELTEKAVFDEEASVTAESEKQPEYQEPISAAGTYDALSVALATQNFSGTVAREILHDQSEFSHNLEGGGAGD